MFGEKWEEHALGGGLKEEDVGSELLGAGVFGGLGHGQKIFLRIGDKRQDGAGHYAD